MYIYSEGYVYLKVVKKRHSYLTFAQRKRRWPKKSHRIRMKDSKTNDLRLRKTECSQILKNRGLLSNIHILLPFRVLLLMLAAAPLYVTMVGTKVITVLGTCSLDH